MKKIRLDRLLVEKGLIETREKAKRTIMAGLVFSGTNRLDKPGVKIPADTPITVKGKESPYVGRGGFKLEKALEYFDVSLIDRVMVDVGASTGGFTDCALQNGVRLCYAVDVGYNQLAWELRQDPRVIVMERTNFRYATPDLFEGDQPNFATIDVSFISLKLMFPPLRHILSAGSDVIALIKPQFEAGKEKVERKGIVRSPAVHMDVIQNCIAFAEESLFHLKDLTFSPITGGDGNIEFLAHFIFNPEQEMLKKDHQEKIKAVVAEAHEML